MRTALKTIDVDGENVEITLDSDTGQFYARADGQDHNAPSLKMLEERVRKQIRSRGRLAIEATLVELDRYQESKPEFEDIVITGKHASNNNVLYRDRHGVTQQMRSYSNDGCTHRLTKTERLEINDLVAKARAANKRVEQWKDDHKLDIWKAIEQARKKGGA